MQNFDCVTGKIICVEGEKAPDPLHIHGDQPGVMNLHAKAPISDDQMFPFRIGRGWVGQKGKDALDFFNFLEREGDWKGEAVVHDPSRR